MIRVTELLLPLMSPFKQDDISPRASTCSVSSVGAFSIGEKATVGVSRGLLLVGMLVMALGIGGNVSAQTTATYIGPNNGNWSDPANWDIGVVPINNGGNTYNVIVPASKIINFDIAGAGTISGLNLVNTGQIEMSSGRSLDVLGFTLVGGNIVADGPGTLFNAVSPLTGFQPSPGFTATNGGVIRVHGTNFVNNTSYAAGVGSPGIFMSASGSGSLIDLSAVVTFEKGASDWLNWGNIVDAYDNGVVDLSSTETVSHTGGNTLIFRMRSGGDIKLSSLDTITAPTATGWNTRLTQFDVQIPTYGLPSLQSADHTHFKLGLGSTLNVGNLTSFRNGTIELTNPGSVINAPKLYDVQGSRIILDGSSNFNTSAITNITDIELNLTNGAVFTSSSPSMVNNRSYAAGVGTPGIFMSANGNGTLIDLHSVTSIQKGASDWLNWGNIVQAVNHGVVNLSNATTLNNYGGNPLIFKVNTGGDIKLNSLATISVPANTGWNTTLIHFDIDLPVFELPNLVSAPHTRFDVRPFNTISLPSLTSLVNGYLDVPALGTISAPNLSSIEGTYFRKSGLTNVSTALVTNANNAQLHAHNGGVIDIAATSYFNNRQYNTNFISSNGAGSRVNLNSVQSFSSADSAYQNTVLAASLGTVDLRAVETISSGNGLRFLAQSGGKINIGGVSQTTSLIDGITRFETTGTNSVIRFGSSIDMAANTVMKATLNGRFEAEGSLILKATDPNNFDLKDGILRMVGTEPQALEVMSHNRGIPTGTMGNEFQIGLLQVGTNTIRSQVVLQDQFVNGGDGTAREALYLQGFPATNGLRILNSSSLILNGYDVFVSDSQGNFASARDLIAPGQRFAAYDDGFISLTGDVGQVLNGNFDSGRTPIALPSWNVKVPVTGGGAKLVDAGRPGRPDNKAAEIYAGSMVELSQQVSTFDDPFFIHFDAWAKNDSGTLSLLLDDNLLGSWNYNELGTGDFMSFSVLVDDPALRGGIDLKLAFQWNANTGHAVWLDDIRMTAVPEPSGAVVLAVAALLLQCRRRSRTTSATNASMAS